MKTLTPEYIRLLYLNIWSLLHLDTQSSTPGYTVFYTCFKWHMIYYASQSHSILRDQSDILLGDGWLWILYQPNLGTLWAFDKMLAPPPSRVWHPYLKLGNSKYLKCIIYIVFGTYLENYIECILFFSEVWFKMKNLHLGFWPIEYPLLQILSSKSSTPTTVMVSFMLVKI